MQFKVICYDSHNGLKNLCIQKSQKQSITPSDDGLINTLSFGICIL